MGTLFIFFNSYLSKIDYEMSNKFFTSSLGSIFNIHTILYSLIACFTDVLKQYISELFDFPSRLWHNSIGKLRVYIPLRNCIICKVQ